MKIPVPHPPRRFHPGRRADRRQQPPARAARPVAAAAMSSSCRSTCWSSACCCWACWRGWAWAGGPARHHRRRARQASGEAARLDREVQRLRQTERRRTAPPPPERARRRARRGRSNARARWSLPNCRRPAGAAPSREDPVGRRGRSPRSTTSALIDRARGAVPCRLRDAAAPSSHHLRADRPRLGRRHPAADAGLDRSRRRPEPSRRQDRHRLPRQRQAASLPSIYGSVPAARRRDRRSRWRCSTAPC